MTDKEKKDCEFCKIINRKQKAYVLYEDDYSICLLDKNPISPGHCLVLSKRHFRNIYNLDEKILQNIIITAKKVSLLLKNKLKAEGVNILHASGKAAQQSIFHFHFHVVPRYKDDGIEAWPESNYKEKSLEGTYKKIMS